MTIDNSQKTLDQITKLIQVLSKEHLQELSYLAISIYKKRLDEEIFLKTQEFKRGDIVTAKKDAQKATGIVMNINTKTIEIMTSNNLRLKINTLYLQHEKRPSKKLLDLKRKLFSLNTYITN